MLIPKEKIIEAKEKLGEKAAQIIAEDLQLKSFDETNLKSLCPFHEEDSGSFIWNPKDNSWKCFGCGKNYGIIDHYIDFYKLTFLEAVEKLFRETSTPYRFGEKGVKTNKDYKYPKYEKNIDRTSVEKYLSLRKISKETLDYCDIQQDNGHNIVFNFYDTNDVLTLVKYRPAKKLARTDTKSWCQKDADTRPLLFNMNRIDPTKPLVITEGETDTLSIVECGYKNVVSVPLGAQNYKWIEENFDWLEQFEKIIVWADNDPPGISMRKEVCSRLGTWRTYYVDLPQTIEQDGEQSQVKDANEVLYHFGKQRVLDLIYAAKELPVTGVKNLASVEDFDLENAPGLYTHLKPLDDIVYKFLFGSVILVTGKKGSGKSTLLNQIFICEPLDQGHDVFLYSGELSPSVLKNWVELSMAGPEKVKMKNDFVHVIDSQARKEMREWYDGRVWVYEEKTNEIDVIIDRAIAVTRKYGAKIWLLDNLMTLGIGANDNNIWQKQKDLIVKLGNLAQLYNVFIVLVAHPRKLAAGIEVSSDDIAGTGDLGNYAQYIMAVKRFSKKEKEGEKDNKGNYRRGKEPIDHDVELDVMKNRFTGKIDKALAYFDYNSYRFYSNPSELWKRYKWNKDRSPLPTGDPNDHSPMPEFMKA